MRIVYKHSKNNTYVYVQRSYRIGVGKNSRNTSENVYKFGNLEDLQKEHPNDLEQFLNEKLNKIEQEYLENKNRTISEYTYHLDPNRKINLGERKKYICGSIFIKKVINELGLSSYIKKLKAFGNYKYEYELDQIISNLICSQILSPSSKCKAYAYAKDSLLKTEYELHDVYRSLDVIAENKDLINDYTYKRIKKYLNINSTVYYYDCTNFYFSQGSTLSELKGESKGKEGIYAPLVQMGILIDEYGFILGLIVFNGKANEQPSLKKLEKDLEKLKQISNVIICTDAGLGSADNRYFNTQNGRSFICTHSLKKSKDFVKKWALEKKNWFIYSNPKNYKFEDEELLTPELLDELYSKASDEDKEKLYNVTLYKERFIKEDIKAEVVDGEDKITVANFEQKIIVTYSIKYKLYQLENLNEDILKAQEVIEKPSLFVKCPSTSYKRLLKNLKVNSEGEIIDGELLELKQNVIKNEKMWFGYYATATNLPDESKKIIALNKYRWQVEYDFRTMKTYFNGRPIRLKTDQHIIGHLVIVCLSTNIMRVIQQKIYYKHGHLIPIGTIPESENKIVNEENKALTLENILNTLRELDITKISNYEDFIPSFTRTNLTDDLQEIFDVHIDTEVIKCKTISKYF